MKKNPLICNLRKECPICKKKYGRKMRGTRESPYLEAVQSWRRSKTCSAKCRSIAGGIRNTVRTKEAKQRQEGIAARLKPAFARFLYYKPMNYAQWSQSH